MKTKNLLYPSFRMVIAFLLMLNFCNSSIAQDDETECPFFNVSSTDSTGVVFSLVSTNIDATVSGVISNVIVEQTYLNSGDSIVDATYVFPMSTNAAIYAMEMQINQKVIAAQIKRRAEAQDIFDNADSLGITTSLLEQHRPNVFQMSLANINPGDTIRVRMTYTELLVPKNGVYQFVFPTIVGPRFTTNGEPWVYQTALDSIPLSETDWNIDLKINAGTTLSAESTTHDATFVYQGNSAETIVNTSPGADFIVNYTLDDNQIETGLLLYEEADENFFLSMIQPAKPDVAYLPPPREYIFIMDVSGSMSGTPLDVSKELIINLLNDLTVEDKFNIIFFAGSSDVLSNNSLPVTNANISMAIQHIEDLGSGGGTFLLPAMELALNMEGTDDFARSFVIITDGHVTVEKEAYELIRENLNEANFFAFGIGTSINRFIIEGIAYVGEGEPFVVTNMGEASEVAEEFKEYLERPVLTNIEAIFEGIDVYDVEPLTIPDVFAERPIIIYGKYHAPAEGTISINGDFGTGIVSNSLNFSDYTENMEENIALKYLWARKRIKLMGDYGIASNENDTLSIEEEITLLGLKYSLVTEFTSFVAVDSCAITGVNTAEEGGGDGGITEVDEIIELALDKDYIKLIGNIAQSEGVLTIELAAALLSEKNLLTIKITDINGRVLNIHELKNVANTENVFNVPLQTMAPGIYFITLFSGDTFTETEKFMIAK